MDDDIEGRPGGERCGLAPELIPLSDDQLTVNYDAILAAANKLYWDRLSYEAEVDRRRMYVTDGVASLQAWISMRTAEGDRAAHHQAHVARTLPAHPGLSEALRNGRLGATHIRLLLTLARHTGAADTDLIAIGETHTVPQLATACRAARRLSRADDDEGHRRRHIRWHHDADGVLHVSGQLHGAGGPIVTNLLTAMAEAAEPDPTSGVLDPFESRCADALVELCAHPDEAGAARGPEVVIHIPLDALDAEPGRDPGADDPDFHLPDPHHPDPHHPDPHHPDHDHPNSDRPHSVHPGSDRPCLSGAGGAAMSAAMTWDGTVISTDTVRRLLCDSRLRLTVDDSEGRAVGIGRRSRTIPDWLAGQIRWRDQGCRFPGCEHTRWLHGHHIRHWADGGPTDLANIATLCSTHHRAMHEGNWRLSGDPDGELTFTGPGGRTHSSHPAVRPTDLTSRPRRPRRARRPTAGASHHPRGHDPGSAP